MAAPPNVVLSPDRKLGLVVLLFVLALALVALAAATEESLSLFFAWVPLVGAGWVLTRPEPPRRGTAPWARSLRGPMPGGPHPPRAPEGDGRREPTLGPGA